MPVAIAPLVCALDATPAAQTAHWALVQNGRSRIIKQLAILKIFFTVQIYKTFYTYPLVFPYSWENVKAFPNLISPFSIYREGQGMSIKSEIIIGRYH